MISHRYPEPRGLEAPTKWYGYYARLSGEEREMLRQARGILRERLGDTPSNTVLLGEVLKAFLGGAR